MQLVAQLRHLTRGAPQRVGIDIETHPASMTRPTSPHETCDHRDFRVIPAGQGLSTAGIGKGGAMAGTVVEEMLPELDAFAHAVRTRSPKTGTWCEAWTVRDVLSQGGPPADYRAVSRVTFTDPEVGSVGMTERAARDAGLDVRVGHADLAESSRGWIHQQGAEGLVKLVAGMFGG